MKYKEENKKEAVVFLPQFIFFRRVFHLTITIFFLIYIKLYKLLLDLSTCKTLFYINY